MTILAILTKFCLKFANLVNFAMSWLLRSICRNNYAPVAKNATVSHSYIFLVIR